MTFAASVDEVVCEHPGYTGTIHRAGRVRIDFVLNQKGIDRRTIESGFVHYPDDKFWEHRIKEEALVGFFDRVNSAGFARMHQEYVASPGTFEYYGHEVIWVLTLKDAEGKVIQQIRAGSSRRNDWPPALRETLDQIVVIAEAGGSHLPTGPLLD